MITSFFIEKKKFQQSVLIGSIIVLNGFPSLIKVFSFLASNLTGKNSNFQTFRQVKRR